MPALDGVLETALYVDDLPRARRFYQDVLGLECLFADAKTRGLNMEDTRLRAAKKLSCLLVIVTLAITWAYRCATVSMGMKNIPRKTHGRRQKSWFRLGLDTLRQWINRDPPRAINAWLQNAPKRTIYIQ